MKVKLFLLETIETFVTSFLVLMLIYWLVAFPELVQGASMEPTIYNNDRLLVDKLTPRFIDYKRGDIIILHPPGNDSIDYVKRIIALPTDTVKILNCKVYVSTASERFILEEPYLNPKTCTADGSKIKEGRSIRLEPGQYLVLGDNRSKSYDSRFFGVISKDRIVGRVAIRFWPPKMAQTF